MSVQHLIILPNLTIQLQGLEGQKQPTTVGGMEGFRKALKGERVSKLGSMPNYQSVWRKWASWCYEA